MAGCALADFGADVIKVEHPDGEVIRRIPPMVPDSTHTVLDQTVNRNKRNLSLDLRNPLGREIFLEWCTTADIVVETFRPGTLDNWGVGYADVREVKPDIVYVSVSGFGQYGELSDRVGYDPLAQNYCGWTSLNGEPDGGPVKAPTFLVDDMAGVHAALGALAALRHRDQTGEGQHVDIALVDSLLYQSNGNPTIGALGLPLDRWGNQFFMAAPVNNYESIDGHVFAGVLLDSHWKLLTNLLDRTDLDDLNLADRLARREEVDTLLADWCRERPVAEIVTTFADLGLPATRVNSYADLINEPHIKTREMLQDVTIADGKTVPITAPAAKLSRTPLSIRMPAPTLGEHNSEVLGELGYDEESREALRRDGVI